MSLPSDVDRASGAAGALWGPAPAFSPPPPGAVDALRDLWRDVEHATAEAAASCRACGQCCDFRRRGHVLFAAKIELDVCLAWAGEHLATDPRVAWSRLGAGLCPFQCEGLCSVRPVRPLGCRLYFCRDVKAGETAALGESVRRRLADVSARVGVRWWYGPALAYFDRNASLLIERS